MNAKRKNPLTVILAALLFIVAYFALFPYPLGKELVAKPVWAVSIGPEAAAAAGAGAENAGAAASFQLAGTFGYVAPDGALLYKGAPLFRVALSDAGFINFSRIGSTWIFQDISGERVFTFSGSGYPVLSPDAKRVFTVSTDLTGIREYDRSGETLWSRDFPCLITCLSVRSDLLAVGLLDGSVQLVSRSGGALLDHAPSGSRIPVILGCAVSADGSRLAAVSGVDGQFLSVLEKQGSSYRPVSRIRLDSDFRREIRMEFSPDAGYLALEGMGSVHLWDSASHRLFTVALSGGLDGLAFLPGRRSAAFVAGNGNRRELVVAKPFSPPYFRESFAAWDVSLGELDGGILLGLDAALLRIDLEEM